MRSSFRLFLFFFLCCVSLLAFGDEETIKVGNLALEGPQQPGSLIAFGENVVNKGEKKLFIVLDTIGRKHEHYSDLFPGFIYGITKDLSILVTTPIALDYQAGSNRSRGVEDTLIQFEYAFYNKETRYFVDQASIVTNVTLPTGSVRKIPTTGIGAPSYFLGMQFQRVYADWLAFTSDGAVFPTSKNGTRFGNIYLYQSGIGRNIMNINGWVLAWVTELDGFFYERNKISGEKDPNSGGNIIYFMPSFWASNKDTILQFGTGWAASQHLFGHQNRATYLVAGTVIWNI